jgi:hypothetical protein
MLRTIPLFTENIFEELLVDWIVLNDQPFTEVESKPLESCLICLSPT